MKGSRRQAQQIERVGRPGNGESPLGNIRRGKVTTAIKCDRGESRIRAHRNCPVVVGSEVHVQRIIKIYGSATAESRSKGTASCVGGACETDCSADLRRLHGAQAKNCRGCNCQKNLRSFHYFPSYCFTK